MMVKATPGSNKVIARPVLTERYIKAPAIRFLIVKALRCSGSAIRRSVRMETPTGTPAMARMSRSSLEIASKTPTAYAIRSEIKYSATLRRPKRNHKRQNDHRVEWRPVRPSRPSRRNRPGRVIGGCGVQPLGGSLVPLDVRARLDQNRG
jgi:hypothetical protein